MKKHILLPLAATALVGMLSWAQGQKTLKLSPAQELVNKMDANLQPHFQEDAGEFGVSRMAGIDVIGGHQHVANEVRRDMMRENKKKPVAPSVGRDYAVGFLRFTKPPGKYLKDVTRHSAVGEKPVRPTYQLLAFSDAENPDSRTVTPEEHQRRSEERNQWAKEIEALCVKSLAKVKQGKAVERQHKGWLVAVRPVKASKDSCLSCHAGAKRDEPLGAMVYTVRL
jgi:hypothetical protein